MARWLRPPFNLDGWRIDVGNMTGRLGATDLNQDVARLIAGRVRGINPEAALLAEATNDAAPDFSGEHWHGAMTYSNFTRPLWSWLAGDARTSTSSAPPCPGPTGRAPRTSWPPTWTWRPPSAGTSGSKT
ncbi:hypothetical protein [Arthrobacter sp. AL12]|uniref:hypothetical protein n=1 Tax=Arthrobacter sp. AL12 TaxID=3042241 RepID=UPI002499F1F1|nr:hypothetical protein [Arthrobacter sp. AL12]MDI3212764.1 hypothetical protein [Arthrobacter sp. AL12]